MNRNEDRVRTLGRVRVETLDSPRILSLSPADAPNQEMIPGAFQPMERRWLAAMIGEVFDAYDRGRQGPGGVAHFPERAELALPKPRGLHPIDHFGRAWNIFMQAAELMGASIYFCDQAGRFLSDDDSADHPNLSLCLKFA